MKVTTQDIVDAHAREVRCGHTLEAALEVVRGAVNRNSEATLRGLALLAVTPNGDRHLIAEESDLLPLIGVRAAAG